MPSIKEMRQICQRSEAAPSWRTQSFEGKFNRIFSIYLTWIFSKLNIQPTPINIAGALAYLGGAALFIFNRLDLQITGLLLMFLSFILDACDGELARFYKLPPARLTVGGAYIEPVSHDVMYGFFFLPLTLGAWFATGNPLVIVAGFMATISKLLFRLVECRYDALRVYMEKKSQIVVSQIASSTDQKTPTSISYFIYRNFFTSTGIFFVLILSVVLRHVDWFLYFYAASFFLFWCYKMSRLWKKINREVGN